MEPSTDPKDPRSEPAGPLLLVPGRQWRRASRLAQVLLGVVGYAFFIPVGLSLADGEPGVAAAFLALPLSAGLLGLLIRRAGRRRISWDGRLLELRGRRTLTARKGDIEHIEVFTADGRSKALTLHLRARKPLRFTADVFDLEDLMRLQETVNAQVGASPLAPTRFPPDPRNAVMKVGWAFLVMGAIFFWMSFSTWRYHRIFGIPVSNSSEGLEIGAMIVTAGILGMGFAYLALGRRLVQSSDGRRLPLARLRGSRAAADLGLVLSAIGAAVLVGLGLLAWSRPWKSDAVGYPLVASLLLGGVALLLGGVRTHRRQGRISIEVSGRILSFTDGKGWTRQANLADIDRVEAGRFLRVHVRGDSRPWVVLSGVFEARDLRAFVEGLAAAGVPITSPQGALQQTAASAKAAPKARAVRIGVGIASFVVPLLVIWLAMAGISEVGVQLGWLVRTHYASNPMDHEDFARDWLVAHGDNGPLVAIAAGGPAPNATTFDTWNQTGLGRFAGDTDAWTYYYGTAVSGYMRVTANSTGAIAGAPEDDLPLPFSTGEPISKVRYSVKSAFDKWGIEAYTPPRWGMVLTATKAGDGLTWVYLDGNGVQRQLEDASGRVRGNAELHDEIGDFASTLAPGAA